MIARALVTGATGMLGSYIVEQLLADGTEVRALVRDPSAARWLEALGARLTVGSLGELDSLVSAAERCDVVLHAAAAIGAGGDWASFHRGNVLGTANVVDAVAATGGRLVHVSSTAVFGRERYRTEPTDESVPLPDLPRNDAYGRSKQRAERLVLGAHEAGRIWASVVRPPAMYGRRDRQFAPRVGPVLERGVFPLIAGGRTTLTLVHAAAVAQGAIGAARTTAAGGRIYHLTNDYPIDVATFVRCAQEGLGRRIRTLEVPLWVGRGGFAGLALGLRLLGRGELARHSRGTLDMLTRDNPFSSSRARAELGWSPSVPPEEGLTEAFRWWKANRNEPSARGRS